MGVGDGVATRPYLPAPLSVPLLRRVPKVLVSALVLIKLADIATDFVAFKCLGTYSVLLSRKREELASQRSEFANLGLQSALAAMQFHAMDTSQDGMLEIEDLVRIFARIDGITPEKARNMAHATFDNIVHSSKVRPHEPSPPLPDYVRPS